MHPLPYSGEGDAYSLFAKNKKIISRLDLKLISFVILKIVNYQKGKLVNNLPLIFSLNTAVTYKS